MTTSTIHVLGAARALVIAAGLLGACTPEQSQPPGEDTDSDSAGTTNAGTSTASTSSATETTAEPTTGDSSTTTAGTSDTTTDTGAGTVTETTGDPSECETPEGCWSCTPTTYKQLLNACTDATCEPFPNTKDRLPLLNDDGTLPPLP